ncbi:hypothetical protein PUR23_10465 [Methylorubrum populi]|uniref:hypothetical protein n=1 Tax=Methylorubrum populi TaxID=223967 RepID=UPI0031F7E1E1
MTGDRLRTDRRQHGSGRRADLGSTLARGLVAGAAGVAAMTLAEKVEQSLTGRPNSYVPAHTLRRILGLPPRPDRERVRMNWAMHWGQGIALGPLRMLMAERGMRGSVASFLFLNLRLLNDQALENATGAGAPPWTWPRDEQRIDLLHKAIYAFVTGYVADGMAQNPDRTRHHGRGGDGDDREAAGEGILRRTALSKGRTAADQGARSAPRKTRAEANRAYGVRVDVPGRAGVPVLVIAQDELDAELLAAQAAGPDAHAEVFRELDRDEIREHGLDLRDRGSVRSLATLRL